MSTLRRQLSIPCAVLLVLCLVLALWALGGHVDAGHDHDHCEVCALLFVLTCTVLPALTLVLVAAPVHAVPDAIARQTQSFVNPCVRFNC